MDKREAAVMDIHVIEDGFILTQEMGGGTTEGGVRFELLQNVSSGMPIVQVGRTYYMLDLESFVGQCLLIGGEISPDDSPHENGLTAEARALKYVEGHLASGVIDNESRQRVLRLVRRALAKSNSVGGES